MGNLACLGFVGTNYNNVANKGDLTRLPVLVGQCANAAEQGVKCYNSVNQTTQRALNLANESKVFRGFSKALNFVRKNINPLIIASSTAKVAMAKKEDRTKTFLTEAGCVSGMFLGEGWMKKNLSKYLDKLPIKGKWKAVVEALVFITGSLTASTIGQKIGKKVADNWDKPLGKNERAAKEALQTAQKAYEPMNLKA